MKEKVTSKAILKDSFDQTKNLENTSKDQKLLDKKYFTFFEHAPIALWIEDFSEAKRLIIKLAKEKKTNVKSYLSNNPSIISELVTLIKVKDVNNTAVKLYKAKDKSDLLGNLNKIFTKNSSEDFFKLVMDVLLGKKETEVETVNETMEGNEFDINIKFNVVEGSEDTLENVIVSVQDITERVKSRNELAKSEKRYKQTNAIAKLGNWYYDYGTGEIYWSDEIFEFIGLDSKKQELSLDFYLSFIHKDDIKLVDNFNIEYLLKNPTQQLKYRIRTVQGEWKYISEKRSVQIHNGRIEKMIGICQDITESTLSEQRLDSTKNMLSNTLSSIKDGFVILDANSNYLYVNEKAALLLGRSPQELMGKHIWTEFPEQQGDLFFDNYQKALKSNKPKIFENYFKPWEKWFENRIIPTSDGVLIFFQEITDKKRAENKIKEAYNIINKSSSVAFLCKNEEDFPVVFASENILKLFGYNHNDFLTNKLKIHRVVFPEDLEFISSEILKFIESKDLKGFKANPFRIVTKKGDIRWIKANIDAIRNDQNEITHIQGIAEDITERIKAEDLFFESNQRLKDQFNNTPLASIMWDLDFKVIEWNNSAKRIFGYSSKEALGKTGGELVIPQDLKLDIQKVWTNLLTQKGGRRYTNENVTKEGKRIICEWYNVPLKDSKGTVIGVASLVNDITERTTSKKLLEKSEKELKIALVKAQESDKLKSAFLANMSHEIRTPMNGIIGFSELFLNPNLSEIDRKRYAKIVINSSKQLLSIVNDVLDISKIEAGVMKLKNERVNLNKLLDDLYEFYKPIAQENNLTVQRVKGLGNFKSVIEIDKTKLNQVLTNLLSNAFKFTNKGSVEFGYQLHNKELQFYVKDTGIGIDEKLQNKIFERFTQADLTQHKKNRGTGLGLSISKKFIELFNGKIWISSNSQGTTVHFTVPYTKVKDTLITTYVAEKKQKVQIEDKEITILVAEDEKYNRMYINELFSNTKIKMIEAKNGKEAVESIHKHPKIDLILMDIKMPVMDGNEAMKEIKKELPHLPIIALSAFAMESDKETALKSGFDSYLTKPIDRKKLFELIHMHTKKN